MSDAEQVALAKTVVDLGVRAGDPAEILQSLARGRSSLILPIVEQKIEAVLKSPEPRDCFTEKSINVDRSLLSMWLAIANVGRAEALREAGKLLKIDEKRFDRMVDQIMSNAVGEHKGFSLAYQGLEMDDPALTRRIVAAMADVLEKERPNIGNPVFEGILIDARHQWAEAMVERYCGVPTANEWATDPLASRLDEKLVSAFYPDVYRYAVDAAARRAEK